MQEVAKKHEMVIVVPLYEEDGDRHLLQHRRRDRRRRDLPRQVPQEPHPALRARASGRSSTSGPATSAIRCSRPATPTSASTSATTATSPRARASWASTARRSSSIRRRRWRGCPSISGSSSSRRTRWPTRIFVGAINRVGYEEPWNIGEFYGQSYFCDPRGQFVARGVARPGRAGDGGAGPRQDPRGAERVAVLPRPPAGDVRRDRQAVGSLCHPERSEGGHARAWSPSLRSG